MSQAAQELSSHLTRLQYLPTFWTPRLRGLSTPLQGDWVLTERARSLRGRRHHLYNVLTLTQPTPKLTIETINQACEDSRLLNAHPLIALKAPDPTLLKPEAVREVLGGQCVKASVLLQYEPGGLRPPSRRPPQDLEIRVLEPGDERIPLIAESVQRESWGFYAPPPKGVYLVVGFIRGNPVASAYFNPVSLNVDFGVHVRRSYWGRGVGSRVLEEVSRLAYEEGGSGFTVVRVLRGRPLGGSDVRALGFYLARGPIGGWMVCVPVCGEYGGSNG